MATISWRDHRTLNEHVLQQYGEFNVFQLMRLLLTRPASTLPVEQRLRFRADLSSAFPAREFSHLRVRSNGKSVADAQEVIEITSANFCIASVLGPLPEPFTEWVRDLARAREPAMADFLDIFNERLNLLRFELKQAQTIALNSLPPAETRVAQGLAALMGLGTPQLAQQVPLPPRAWLGLAGLLANRRKNATTVAHVLNLVLHAKVTLTPLIGGWQKIERQDRTALGQRNRQLGQTSVLGHRVWDQQARIRLEIETLDYEGLCRLLPPNLAEIAAAESAPEPAPASYFARFLALLQLLLDRLVDCEIILKVDAAGIPPAHLRRSAPAMRLGQTAWLHRSQSAQQAPRRVRYVIHANDSMRLA